MKLYVTVCKNTVLQNVRRAREGKRLKPPLRVSWGKRGKPRYERLVTLVDPGTVKIVYDPGHPLPWGARAWVEAEE